MKISTFSNSKKNSFRGNYLLKYGTYFYYTSCTDYLFINQIDINEQGAEILNHDVPGCTIKFWCTK